QHKERLGPAKEPDTLQRVVDLAFDFLPVPDLRVDDRLDERVHQRTGDRKADNGQISSPGDRQDTAYDCDPGKPDTQEHQRIHVLVDDPVKDRTEVGVGVGTACDTAVDQIEERGEEQQQAPGKERTLVWRDTAPDKNPGNRLQVLLEPGAESGNVHSSHHGYTNH